MTAVIYSLHTHAEGEGKGWWGAAIHPAHWDEDKKEFMHNEWHIDVVASPDSVTCLAFLRQQAEPKLSITRGHEERHA